MLLIHHQAGYAGRIIFRTDPTDVQKYLTAILVGSATQAGLSLISSISAPSNQRRSKTAEGKVSKLTRSKPTLLIMTNYEGLAKIANYVGPNDVAYTCLPTHADVLSKMFLAADLFSLVFEVSGGVIIAKADRDPQRYKYGQRVCS